MQTRNTFCGTRYLSHCHAIQPSSCVSVLMLLWACSQFCLWITSNLSKARETRDSLSSSYSQVVLIYLSISTQFTLKIYATDTNCKKALNPYFKSLRSFNLLSGNPKRYSGRLLCTKNGNPDWDSERSYSCLLYTSPSPRDRTRSRMPSSAWKKSKATMNFWASIISSAGNVQNTRVVNYFNF